MNLAITLTEGSLLTSPVKAQFIDDKTGKLWTLAAGETPGSWQAEADVEQAATLSDDIAVSAKSCRFIVSVPDGLRAADGPRFVTLHLYNSGTTDKVAFACRVDLTTGEVFDPFFVMPVTIGGDVLAQIL